MSDWHTLKLVNRLKSLNEGLAAKLTTVFDHVKPLLGHTRPQGSEEFTDHDLAHSTRVVHRIGQFLPDTASLNGTELYLLLLAVLLHDSGMWGPKEEVLALPQDTAFCEWAARSQPDQWRHVQEDLANPPRRWMGEMGLRQLAATWFRIHHPARLGSFVLDPASPTGSTLRVLIGEKYITPLVSVGVAHSWERKRVLEDPALDPHEIGGDPVNLRFLASLLRLGDLLDLGEGRISTLLWSYLRPLNPVSEAHWRKEHTLTVRNCTPDLIEVGGTFDIDTGGTTTAEAYRLALDWLEWLECEIKECARVLPLHVPDAYAPRCRLGKLDFDRSKVQAKGLVVGGPVTFELNRQRILELLGDEIYSSGTVFVRELMQNALDATRAQIIRDNKALIVSDPIAYPPDRPWDWPHSLTGSDRYAITVTVTEEKDTRGRDLILFSVTDQGTGMTLRQIQNHFLQVGLSYYQSQAFRDEFQFRPISRFGIGFLSCLTIAKDSRIEVHTRAAGEAYGLRLSIQMPSDQYLVTKDESLPQGTTVKVWIDPAAGHPPGWDEPPLDESPIDSSSIDIGRAVDCASQTYSWDEAGRISEAVRQWIPFPEFRFRINHLTWGPRPAEAGQFADEVIIEGRANQCSAVRLPLRFLTPTGRLLGNGTFLKRSYSSGLPMEIKLQDSNGFRDRFAKIHTHKGVFISKRLDTAEKALLVWNTIALPLRSVSAARLLRIELTGLTTGLASWLFAWLRNIHGLLESRSLELASLWRFLLQGSFNNELLPPRRYPVRRGNSLDWLTLEEIRKIAPVILVPFGISWREAVAECLPLVGLVDSVELQAHQCKLVIVPGRCTGLLWPPESTTSSVKYFRNGVTFTSFDNTPMGSYFLEQPPAHLSRTELRAYPSHTYRIEQLALYDRGENPWRKFGLYIANKSDLGFQNNNHTGQLANQLLNETPPLPLPPPELLRVVIPDGDSWE